MSDTFGVVPDTITALATPSGRGGVAILRISGPQTKKVMMAMLQQMLPARVATFTSFYASNHEVLDQGIALFFPAPHSFTGEDVLELHAHGGPVLVDLLLAEILQYGVRLARPGEFSERAFLNNKIDLARAEAIADLIDASSKEAARSALRSLQGEFSSLIQKLTHDITQLRVFVEAQIDFSDEEIDFLSTSNIQGQIRQIANDIADILAKAKQGSLLREGFTGVIIGEPNVGKSSLLNCLSGRETAIVTDIPGTTRDLIRDTILIDGIPMHLIDTAGIRQSTDKVEQEGIRRASQELQQADVIIYMLAATQASSQHFLNTLNVNELEVMQHLPGVTFDRKRLIVVINKVDLLANAPAAVQGTDFPVLMLSAKFGQHITDLKEAIKTKIGAEQMAEGTYLARRRHLDALSRAHTQLEASLAQLQVSQLELAAENLRLSQQALSEITGEFTSDDLLGKIFASFCIGK